MENGVTVLTFSPPHPPPDMALPGWDTFSTPSICSQVGWYPRHSPALCPTENPFEEIGARQESDCLRAEGQGLKALWTQLHSLLFCGLFQDGCS